MMPACLYVR